MAKKDKDEAPVIVRKGYLLIDAYREEAALFRYNENETAAKRLEQMADRAEAIYKRRNKHVA